jgi:hypothetical protein
MRSGLALLASALAGLAAVISSLDGDADLVPFFIGLTLLGGVGAWALALPPADGRRRIGLGAALVWLFAAGWVAVLLGMEGTVWQASSPPPMPEDSYAGLTATGYRVIGLFGGAIAMAAAAYLPERWLRRVPSGG